MEDAEEGRGAVRRLFGTDGVRGVANRDLTPDLALLLGRAFGRLLHRGETRPTCVVGRDSRLSGEMLEAALAAGLMSAGVDVLHVGVLPTPAVSLLTAVWSASAGAVVSASHNPVDDNGIKFFGPGGEKLADELEEEVERELAADARGPTGRGVGRAYQRHEEARRTYVAELRRGQEGVLPGRVVLDAAFGAAATVVREIWQGLAEDVVVLNGTPDGVRINVACGSTHPEVVAEAVRAMGATLGLAFDGDADRLVAVDEEGNVADGNHLLFAFARHLRRRGELGTPRVAVSVMANLGLREALAREGIGVVETKVGDRYLLEAMRREGIALGGEPSGHIVLRSRAATGDGLRSSLVLREVLLSEGVRLADLVRLVPIYPQQLVNLPAPAEGPSAFLARPDVQECVRRAAEELQGMGRVLIRPSGTEPVLRVMVEAKEETRLRLVLGRLVADLESLAQGRDAEQVGAGRESPCAAS